MNKALLLVLTLAGTTAAYAGDVGVSLSFDQPGIYGQINIGNVPAPQLIYAQPVMVAPPPPAVMVPAPLYLHVPPGYEVHWRRHCAEYHACGRPVYFVRDGWYRNVYVPARRDYEQREWREHHDRGEHRGEDRRDWREHRHGHGHGHGHDDHGDDDR